MEAASTLAPASIPQHMQALEHANRIRLARASLKRAVGAGQVDAAEIVRDPPGGRVDDVGELLQPAALGTDAGAQVPLLHGAQREP